MYKKISLFLMCSLLAGAVQAGPGPRRFARKAKAVLNRQSVTHTLKARVKNSYQNAIQATRQLSDQNYFSFFEETPVKKFVHLNQQVPFPAEEIYPQAPFLTTNRQTSLYLQAKINREILKTIAHTQQWADRVHEHQLDFEHAHVPITHRPEEDVAWLARQIPDDTLYLLLGEVHNIPEVSPTINQLIRTLRKQQPEREIFLFTEFIFHKSHVVVNECYDDFFADLESDTALDIPIIGLEPDFAEENIYLRGGKYRENLWKTDEGIRLRNEYWLNIINQYRKENPNALFIIYAGLYHTEYHCPYSLGNVLQGPNTFAVSFVTEAITLPFDYLTKINFLFDRILQFNDKELSRLAGFDVRIRMPDANTDD